jgi:two-component system response regulator AtoC
MAATHRDLHMAIANETFREDLYYRLNVINVCIPPLRERKEDVLTLAHRFLQKHANGGPVPVLTAGLQHAMLQYDWPGNIRELENLIRRFLVFRDASEMIRELGIRAERRADRVMEARQAVPQRAVAMTRRAAAGAGFGSSYDTGAVTEVEDAPPEPAASPSVLMQVARAKEEAEATAILQALHSTHWNRKRAALRLNIDYKALLYKMKKLSIGNSPQLRD